MDPTIISSIFEGLLFGSTWYIGIIIFLILALSLMKMWKYSGCIVIPIILIVEVEYYNRGGVDGSFIWPMIILGITALSILTYTISEANRKN